VTAVRCTNRWRGVAALAVAALAVGVAGKRPLVLLTGVVGVVYAAYPHVVGRPDPDLALDRTVSDASPAPGDEVEVAVTVRNDGDATLWDLRVVDGVPAMLRVTGGTPRHAAVLRPGETATLRYAVAADQGIHRFDPATVLARDPSGGTEVETTATAETTVESRAGSTAAGAATDRAAGVHPADEAAAGVEFARTREYRRGDPRSRVDWKRFARTGDLTTVEFRPDRAASVVVAVDARRAAYVGQPDQPHAVARAVAAAEQVVAGVADAGDRVGVTGFGRGPVWLQPGVGRGHRARARRLLSGPAFAARAPDESTDLDGQLAALRARLGGDAAIVLFSPLADDDAARAARLLAAWGHAITVVSPDPTADEGAGTGLAGVERATRVAALRSAGARVVDWQPDEPLAAAVARTPEVRA
jgi:uncharacterized repeat protein (TIGR01451 family)